MGLLDAERWQVERTARDELVCRLDLGEDGGDVDAAMLRSVRRQASAGLSELTRAGDALPAACLVPGDRDVDEALEEVPLLLGSSSPGELEFLVCLEERTATHQRKPACQFLVAGHDPDFPAISWYIPRVATILLAGVDLFFRGKLEALLPEHHFVTADTVEAPELVITDVSRIDPDEVADAYPDIPIVGFTNHTDTSGLRAAHAAGFDQVLAKSALAERIADLVRELVPSVE